MTECFFPAWQAACSMCSPCCHILQLTLVSNSRQLNINCPYHDVPSQPGKMGFGPHAHPAHVLDSVVDCCLFKIVTLVNAASWALRPALRASKSTLKMSSPACCSALCCPAACSADDAAAVCTYVPRDHASHGDVYMQQHHASQCDTYTQSLPTGLCMTR